MTTLTPEQSFQEKVKARIRESIGDLMPDEMLQQLVSRAIEDAFFAKRETTYRVGCGKSYDEPWITEFMRSELGKQVQVAVTDWMAANSDKLTAIVQQTLDGGILTCVTRAIDRQFSSPIRDLEDKLTTLVSRLRGDQ